jgi:hypothetical protein
MEKDPSADDRKYAEQSLAGERESLRRILKSPTLAKYPRLKRQVIAIQVEAISEIKRLLEIDRRLKTE